MSENCKDFDCNVPTPRSVFNEGPLCPSIAQFLYDPANCDPGYWCGCSSANPDDCFPSNDPNTTLWGGHFTTVNKTSGETIVLTGRFGNDGLVRKCPEPYFCPGLSDTSRCVDLCEPGKFCPDASQMLDCPEGKYCPIGTSEPLDCRGLAACNDPGQRRFKTGYAAAVMILYILLAVATLFLGKRWLIKNRTGSTKEKATDSTQDTSDDQRDDEGLCEVTLSEEQPTSGLRKPNMEMNIDFQDLQLSIPNVGNIMKAVSGRLRSGTLTAVMGPSGAGKTTFLNIMSGKIDRSGGVIKVNGEKCELTKFQPMIGFVPQDDVMLRELSVEENVTHSAMMRLPSGWSKQEKMKQVDQILKALEIGHVRESVVGDEKRRGVSGGQRKRVNIAIEMVTNPSLLCLDEPTSGLDSTASFTVIESLKRMTTTGTTVCAVIHQPKYEVFELFDQVILLGKGGQTVYAGPTDEMTDYFEMRGFPLPAKANPADYYMDVLAGNIKHNTDPTFKKEDLFLAWMTAEENPSRVTLQEAESYMEKLALQNSSDGKEFGKVQKGLQSVQTELVALKNHLQRGAPTTDNDDTHSPLSVMQQTVLLFRRICLQRIRSPGSTLLNIFLMIIAGSILPGMVPQGTTLYVGVPLALTDSDEPDLVAGLRENVRPFDGIPSVLLNVYLFLLIVSCLSVNVLSSERTVFFRETATGQSVTAYWLAKTLDLLFWLPVYACAFCLLGYSSESWLLAPLGVYFVFIFLTLFGFYGFGMVASLLVGGGNAGLLALVFGIISIIAFSGTVSAYGDSEIQGFLNCWFLFWSTQGIVSEEYDQYRYAFDVDFLNQQTLNNIVFGSGSQSVGAGIGKGFDLSSSLARNILFCTLTACAWHLIVLWTLKTRDHRKHR